MPDGVQLNAFLFLPANQRTNAKIPGVINTVPYRYQPSGDSYFARNGYASIFVDVRGTGGSEGVPLDEYSSAEYEDTTDVIDWLSKQPWCNGNIGMYGLSYGAFNSVYEAALKPPALKAICAFSGTDRRYTDDIHCPGGTMLMIDQAWAFRMVSSNALPGAPDFNLDSHASLDRWNATPWIDIFLRNQRYGPHWAYGSLAPDYSRLTTPALLAGGYLDIYQNFVPRIMKNSPAVTKGILGPWSHSLREPGPKIDWSAVEVGWFDRWLKGLDTGILREPRVSFYMPGWRRESLSFSGEVPGEWRHLNEWPETVFTPKDRLYLRPNPELPEAAVLRQEPALGQGGWLSELSGPASALRLRYMPGRGGSDQSFFPEGGYYGLDSRDEDVYGLAFDTAPLRTPLEILGFTRARLFVSSTAPVANWIARLSDVAPDGTSYLVSRGYLNGTHRRSHTRPEPLRNGEVYEIALEMWFVAHRFEPSHRVRLVVTNAEFPVIWPSPYPMTTTLYSGGDHASFVELPVLPQLQYLSSNLSRFTAKPSPDKLPTYRLTRDFASGVHSVSLDSGDQRIWCDVKDDDPATASLQFSASEKGSSPDGSRQVEACAEGTLRSTTDYFILDIKCTLLENGKIVRSRLWKDQVRRALV